MEEFNPRNVIAEIMSEHCERCFGGDCEACCYLESVNMAYKLIRSAECPQSVKDDDGKPKMHLILPGAAMALCMVREYGLKKYPQADNWKSVPKEKWLDAMLRHTMKILSGEEYDDESEMPHAWHILCNISYYVEACLMEEACND